jgi:spermidine synthase
MELWVTEKYNDFSLSLKVKETLYRERSVYQEILIVDTYAFGRVLLLDSTIQTTEKDEFYYHEMLIHVPLCAHTHPERILIIGGGDGGCVRETLKHPSVKKIVHVEIDGKVVEACQKYLPLLNPDPLNHKIELHIADGIEYVKNGEDQFDVIVIDSTDPVGPAANLFGYDFYQSIYQALRADGIIVTQSESPFLHTPFIKKIFHTMSQAFPYVRVYFSPMPTYPSGTWSYTVGSKINDPALPVRALPQGMTRYYNGDIHKSAFALPNYLIDILTNNH